MISSAPFRKRIGHTVRRLVGQDDAIFDPQSCVLAGILRTTNEVAHQSFGDKFGRQLGVEHHRRVWSLRRRVSRRLFEIDENFRRINLHR